MKKLFTFFIIFFLVTNISVCTHAQEQEDETEDNSYFTIELIENSFWEELEAAHRCKSREDVYISMLIAGISKPKKIPAYRDLSYVSYHLTGIRKDKVDIDRLVYKCQLVVLLYNNSHDLQLSMEERNITSMRTYIYVHSEKPDYVTNMVTMNGQIANLMEGAVYWESAQGFGSGKSGISEARVVQINGVAYLDENGKIIHSYYGTTPRKIHILKMRMLHICTVDSGDLGWVDPTQLTSIDE